jgi:hypothetical protein
MKSALRENRMPKGTKAKVRRIVRDMNATPHRRLVNPSGNLIFATWTDMMLARSRR